ncbi:MAG: hypothetical protein QNJ08_02825, partial [Crocosphaera sp.]|nr:hypothetical protein [Crocosphaera sp.]
AQFAYNGFGINHTWTNQNAVPRFLADVNGDGKDDIVGFASDGVYVALNNVANKQQQEIDFITKTNQEKAISSLQNLRVETAYLTLQAEQNPDKLQNYLKAYLASDKTETSLNQLRNQYYPALSDATTLYNLQQQISDSLTNSQQQLETLKTQIAQKQANATAALSQADWYEEQAEIHWELSRKAGPTWTEQRVTWKRGKSGRKKRHVVTVTHVDHDWIIWDTYTKQATNLRKHAANLDQEVIEDSQQQDLTDQLIAQWQEANQAADTAELTLDQFIAELELLEAQRQLLPEQEAQLETFSELLPTLKEQLAIAQQAADEAKINTATELAEYDNSSQAYQTALNDVLEKKATLDTNTQNLLQQIANTRAWVEQQTLSLDTELSETVALQLELQTQLDEIALQTPTPETETKTIQLQHSIDLFNQKQIILTAQQTALTQKITLLEAQKTVVETEHQLLLATIDSPDSDYSNLENQLLDAQNALAEVQELAQQAEATSIALTASMEDLQAFLEVQNDQYLTEIQAKQSTLQQLLDATELKENYTLLATEKQLELNTLETQLQTRLIEATEAGSQEAAYLLTVAQQNNFATAAEIYYRDYRDLMTDTGGGCAGGIARPDDAVKADYYYNEMVKYRALQEQAQQQADQFAIVKETAEDQIDLIQQQQAIAQTEFNDIQSSINNTQEDIESLQQQLNIAELRIDALEYLRNWTEQTLVQLLQVEQLNLAQATLEQEFATQRQLGIDETITAKFEKQQADIERDRAIATAKLEQLNQLQAEDALQQALNDLRTDLGLQPIEDIIQQAEYKGQLAGILSDLETIQSQPELPQNIQTILAETTADIHDALQGKEVQTIQENLLNSANALITEANQLQTEIAKLDAEEEQLLGILEQSETDLKGATKDLYDEIIISQELGEESDEINQDYLEVLYKIGYAEGAVDLSSELAKQSKDILNQIIEGRIQERKARKKAFVNELLGTVTLVLSVASLAITAGASLAAWSFTQPAISVTLSSISAGISAVQAAYNGDWSAAIFNAGMAVLGAAELDVLAQDLTPIEELNQLKELQDIRQVTSGLYYGYQAAEAGDNLSALLNVFSAALPITELTKYNYLSQAALNINSGVQLAEEGEWLAATSSFLNAVVTLGKNLDFVDNNRFLEEMTEILRSVELSVNLAAGIETITDDGSLEGWLQGIQQIANGAINYIQYEPPKTTTITLQEIDENIIKDLALEKIANSDTSESTSVEQVEESLLRVIDRIKNFDYEGMVSSDFTKEDLQQTFLDLIIFNPEVTAQQIIETGELTIDKFQTDEEKEENRYFKEKYPNYESFSAHQDARAILHFLTGIPASEISQHQAGLGITGTKKINLQATFSDKWRQRTAFHDVTSTLDLKLNELDEKRKNKINVKSWNKSVYGVESIFLSAFTGVGIPGTIEELFDFDLEGTTGLVDILFKLTLKPINWVTEQIDPLIIDLDDNGINLINLDNSLIRFDFDADGYAENTAWVSPEDGILTLDLNQDGTINNITEVFSEYFNDGSPTSGLDALATLDSNQNGIISVTDTQFNQILVWQDINQDGISQPDELKTLTDHGITSINLNGITTETIQDGNIIKKRSLFNRNDGSSGEISDIAFLVTQTGFKVNQTDTGIEILAEDDTAVSLFIHEDETGLTLNLADNNLQVAIGNIGNDTIYTTANNDIFLSGEAGDDTLVGSAANDWLVGDEGSDRLEGFAGDDLLYIDAQDNFIDGGEGTDIAIVTTIDAVTLDLGNANLEMVIGNDGDDIFTHSGNYTVVMDGGNGNDNLTGGSNDDVITGGDGDDYIQGSDGSDRIEGSQGNDNLHGWVGSDEIYGGLDNDTLYGQQDNDSLYGDEGDDQLHGNEGDDRLEGGDGSDTLYGHQGNDTLLGNTGDDQLYGDAGDDSLQGGEGNDQLFGNIGHDILFGNQGDDLLYGEDGNDTISGDNGNDQLHGWNGSDLLHGGDGQDTLYGHFDDDTLTGGTNDDVLNGGNGNDIITGGLGGDILTGGNDVDIFVYNSFNDSTTTNPDRITDFEPGRDYIDLSNLLLDSFNDLTITQTDGSLTISVNSQDFVVNLNNELTLTAEDFIF